MKWAPFFHFYQPAEQQKDILEAVVVECYRPLFKYFAENDNVKITINVGGSLLELFDKYKYYDLIDYLRVAAEKGHIEFTGSAKYHAFLPFLEPAEIERQISINDETSRFFLGDVYKPKGFFPPEMAYTPELPAILEKLGFSWMLLDEIAYNGKPDAVDYSKFYQIKDPSADEAGSSIKVFFKERKVSNVLMSAVARTPDTFARILEKDLPKDKYLVTGMDGETFGHHRPGLELSLFELLSSSKFTFSKISDLLNEKRPIEKFIPVLSTWASSQDDIEKGIQYLSWSDPDNEIHKLQWQLLHLVFESVKKISPTDTAYKKARHLMDIATASDHFWWASAKPWWSVEMIEDGAYKLMETVRAVPSVDTKILSEASKLYEAIVSTAFEWQRSGKVREMANSQKTIVRIPFKERTVGKGGEEEGVYHAFIKMMEDLEKKAASQTLYEEAILWRDAKYKLEHKLDIYDGIHAVDILRTRIPHEEIEKTIEKYKEQYRKMRGGQPEQRGA